MAGKIKGIIIEDYSQYKIKNIKWHLTETSAVFKAQHRQF